MQNSTPNIIKNSLAYYDTNFNKHELQKYKYFTFKKSKNNYTPDKIYLYDEKKNIITTANYQFLGIFDSNSHTWIWGWSVPNVRKNSISLAKKILNYGFDLEPKHSFILKPMLITSRFIVADNNQLDITLSIASYITKTPTIFKIASPVSFTDKLQKVNTKSKEGDIIFYLFVDYENSKDNI